LSKRLAALKERQKTHDDLIHSYDLAESLVRLDQLTERVEKLDAHSKHQNFRLYHLERDPELEQGKENT
jgi:hypothetical protein